MAKPIHTRNCENCNKPISREEKKCHHCGQGLKRETGRTGCVLIALVVGIIVIGAISVFKYISQSDFDPEDPSAGEGQSHVTHVDANRPV